MLPLFLNLTGRPALVVGEGPVAAAKACSLAVAGAIVRIVTPESFTAHDLDEVWLVISAATPAINREVAAAAEARRIFVNAVDDPDSASAFLGGVVRRSGVTIAISTSGAAPALTSLLREAIDAVLPADLEDWVVRAQAERIGWRRDGVAIDRRRPLLLDALNALYRPREESGA
jgi:uroporphyrin-III C-methyltransferase/precorrin-2 dehydrogenase/sirohydrochlorin ferrochelatase